MDRPAAGDQVGYASYRNISSLALSGETDFLIMAEPEKLTGTAIVAGQRVIGVSGPASDQLPAGTLQLLYVADDSTMRPVRVTLRGGHLKDTTTYSKWGERVDLNPPPDSLAAATLSPSTSS